MLDWGGKNAANYKEFVTSALTVALEIVEGKWHREYDWEVYIMSRQNLMLAIEIMKAMEVDNNGC